LGSGVETFGYSYYQDRPQEHNLVSEWDFLYNKAHNEFLNFLATTGIFGLGSYCLLLATFLGFTGRRIKRAIELDKHQRALFYSSLIAGVIALSIFNFFGFSTVMVAIIMFLYFALSEIFEAPLLPATSAPHQLASWQHMTIVVISLVSLFGIYRTYTYWTADMSYTRGRALLEQGELELGLEELSVAISKSPEEAIFYDTLADQYAVYAMHFANAGQATQAAELTRRALEASDVVLNLNPRQINFYKTRARILINLAQIDSRLLPEAKSILQQALTLAPTDAKLLYNLGLIEFWMNNPSEGVQRLQETIALKPNYESARWQLAQEYEKQGKTQDAITQLTYMLQNINPNNKLAQDKLASLSAQKK
jgi:cytochrome c-type biogenesis protein CcmH/NrfG